jgi:hypothetical protein
MVKPVEINHFCLGKNGYGHNILCAFLMENCFPNLGEMILVPCFIKCSAFSACCMDTKITFELQV